MRLCNLLPLKAQHVLGRLLGQLLFTVAKERRRVARINLKLCFPDLSSTEREKLLRETFIEQGKGLIEAGLAWWPRPELVTPYADVTGMQHIDYAQEQGRGVLLLCGHFTMLDVAGLILSQRLDYDGMYRLNNNPLIEKISTRGRKAFFGELIERRDIRRLIKRLKEGRIVWYAPDQDMGKNQTVFAPFFGVPAATLTATARIAKMTNAAVVPIALRRKLNGRYLLEIQPALENFPSGDDVADATTVNQTLEHMVSEAPSQYMWVHRRFKTHPKGKNYLYKHTN